MWILILVLLLLGAHLNLTALIPLQPGDPSPPHGGIWVRRERIGADGCRLEAEIPPGVSADVRFPLRGWQIVPTGSAPPSQSRDRDCSRFERLERGRQAWETVDG